jgi:hypothetical protein
MKPLLHITGFWAAVLLGAWIYGNADVPQPPGVLAPDEPQQVDIVERTWNRGDARFTALARFEMRGRVLSTNHYFFDAGAGISPVDLALGWGRMSDSAVLDELSIRQSGRCFFWRPHFGHELPIPMKEVTSHSSNMHMIPANDQIKKTLEDLRAGEVIDLKGFLVQVNRPNGWTWKTSLSRTDTGMGACEVVWVESLYH